MDRSVPPTPPGPNPAGPEDRHTETGELPPEPRKQRLLLVEDDSATRLTLLQKFRQAGLDVDVAVNGALAVDKVRRSCPDAIFMDLLLPQVGGVEVIKEIRKYTQFGNRPIFVCTSAARMDAWSGRALKAGATKVFDRGATPVDVIIAEVAATLRSEPTHEAAASSGPGPAVSVQAPEPAAENPPTLPSYNLMKRVLKSFGLGKTANASATPAPPIPPVEPNPTPVALAGAAAAPSEPPPLPGSQAFTAQDAEIPEQRPGTAVVTLDETNQIISADDACSLMFGWASGELAGQSLRVLLQEGTDQLVARFLQEQPQAGRNQGSGVVHVNARRKDGTQFPASVTTLTWSSDTAHIKKDQGGRFCWTAVFRALQSVGAASPDAAIAVGAGLAFESTPERVEPPGPTPGLPAEASPTQAESAGRAAEAAWHELNLVREVLNQERAQRLSMQQQLQDLTVVKARLEQQLAEQNYGSVDLRKTADGLGQQLAEANDSARMAASALQEQVAQARRVEDELAAVRQDRDELQLKLGTQEEAVTALRQRSVELEKELQAAAGDLQAARATAEQKQAEGGKLTAKLHAQESDLQLQLNEAKAAVERAETSLRAETERNQAFEARLRLFGDTLRTEQKDRSKRFEEEMLQLRRQRDELQGTLTAEQQAAANAQQRADELENRLAENVATLALAQNERDKQHSERQQSEAELRVQLAMAETLAKKLQDACAQAEEHSRRLEGELGDLRQQRDDLSARLSTEQRAAAESRQRVDELESRLRDNAAELERIKGQLQATGRHDAFEIELASLRQVRDALCSKLAAEQWTGNESKRRSAELEGQLSTNAAELDRVKADLDKLTGDQAQMISDLQAQLQTTTATTAQLQAALQDQTGRCQQLEGELTTLQYEHQDLSSNLTSEREAAEVFKQRSGELESRLSESATELRRLKAERDQQTANQASLEAQLQEQLQAARAAAEQAEAARREEAVHHREFQERLRDFAKQLQKEEAKHVQKSQKEIAELRQQQDRLQQQLAEAKKAAATAEQVQRQTLGDLEKAKTSLKELNQKRSGADSELRTQLSAARAAAQKLEANLKQANEQSTRYEQELANYRQERHEIYEKFGAEHQTGIKAKRRVRQLEKELSDATRSLAGVKEQLEKAAAERAHVESTLRAELTAAQTGARKAESAGQTQSAQTERLKSELEKLRAKHDELSAKQSAKRDSDQETNRKIEELEQRLRESAAELGRAQAALAHQAAQPAPAAASAGSAAQSEEVRQELCRLRETEAAQTAELSVMERRVRETVASLARVTAALEKERGERRRVEQRSTALTAQLQELHQNLKQHLESESSTQERITHLEQQLLEREDTANRVQSELQKETAGRQLAEEQLRTTGDLQAHLRNCLASFEQAKTGFRRMQEELNTRLQASQASLNESEVRVQKEITERQRAEEALAAAQRAFQEQSQTAGLELTKLQSEMQMHEFEKQQLQAESVQSRYASVDSARVGSVMVNNLRRQIRQPVEDVLQSTRRLLEGGLEAEQKKLAESVLENALLLQSGLQEVAADAGAQPSPQAARAPGVAYDLSADQLKP
ncbi:MAG TPA: response regulator [Verrucomicrobiae bacterium]|nr:response regulator [Verrucomicrobiae bacterium]